MRRRSVVALVLALAASAACVPADEAGTMGSVEFVVQASEKTRLGIDLSNDGWALRFDRVVVGFKTMTIGRVGVADACAYRGRGASSNVVFDPRQGLVQAFNGLSPTLCPDVGIILGSPDAQTTLGQGASSADLDELARGEPAHAIIDATAVSQLPWELDSPPSPGERDRRTLRLHLRFETAKTPSRFGGCQSPLTSDEKGPTRGIAIEAGERRYRTVRFAAERIFRDAIADNAALRVGYFQLADRNDDGVVTMQELDATPFEWTGYDRPGGVSLKTFGDWVRLLFRSAFTFGERGACFGNPPGEEAAGATSPSP